MSSEDLIRSLIQKQQQQDKSEEARLAAIEDGQRAENDRVRAYAKQIQNFVATEFGFDTKFTERGMWTSKSERTYKYKSCPASLALFLPDNRAYEDIGPYCTFEFVTLQKSFSLNSRGIVYEDGTWKKYIDDYTDFGIRRELNQFAAYVHGFALIGYSTWWTHRTHNSGERLTQHYGTWDIFKPVLLSALQRHFTNSQRSS